MKLSKAQIKCAHHNEGAALVLAGPGSGKTTVITERINYLTTGITKPSKLLSVTFSRAAGREMTLRYSSMYPERELPMFSTIHSLCNKIITDYEKRTRKSLTRIEGDTSIKRDILKNIWKDNNPSIEMPDISDLISCVSRKLNCPDFNLNYDGIRNFDDIYRQYREYKIKNNLIDFDDMIFFAKELLENNKMIQELWSTKYEYIQVDEGQDLSKAQFSVVSYLAGCGNVFVVADDDQGIYAFRGADPTCVLEFEKYYPECKRYYLEENYRSCGRIVECASKVVSNNKSRYDKNLFTKNIRGDKLDFLHCKNLNIQAKYICDKIRKTSDKETVAVLYRNSISSLMIRLYLEYYGLSYSVYGGNLNIEYDYIVKYILNSLKKSEENKGLIVPHPKRVFESLVAKGLLEKANEYYEKRGEKHIRYLYEFFYALCTLYNSYEQIVKAINKINAIHKENCNIVLSTIHSAKGLEFDKVFIIDLLNDEFPSRESFSNELLEEERRLFYVAMTRAKKKLYLSYPEIRGKNYEEASIFYEECILASHK